MKPYIISVLLLINYNLCAQISQKETANKFKKLNITLVTGSSIVLQNGIINTEESKSFITVYNGNGKPVEETLANIKDGSAIVYKYHYGKCGDIEKWEWLQMQNGKTGTVQIQQIIFDENCRKKEIIWKDSTGLVTTIRYYEYDKKGRQIKETDKDTTGQLTSYVITSYPDSFTVIQKGYFGDSTFWTGSHERYDRKGNRTYYVSFDENGKRATDEQRTKYIYDGNRLKEEITYNHKGKATSKTTYYYNVDDLVDRIERKATEGDVDIETITIYKYRKK